MSNFNLMSNFNFLCSALSALFAMLLNDPDAGYLAIEFMAFGLIFKK